MIETFKRQIRSITGREGRKVYVYLPDAYLDDPEARFPVLYMFDGHNVFFDEDATYGKSWGMKEFLEEHEVPLMVVAVDCNHHPDNGRLSEYSPYDFRDEAFGSVHGRGDLFMEWLTGKLKPEIDRRYPTLPERENTFIAGSSMGGLMSLYAITAYNRVFSRAAALSPSIWVNGRRLRKQIREADMAPDTVIYLDYGSRELENHEAMLHEFTLTASALMERGLWVNARIVPNGDHSEECWEEQVPFFMETLAYSRE